MITRIIEIKSPHGKDASGLVSILKSKGINASVIKNDELQTTSGEAIRVAYEGNYVENVLSRIGQANYRIISDRREEQTQPQEPTQQETPQESYK